MDVNSAHPVLYQNISGAYQRLVSAIEACPASVRTVAALHGTGGAVSISDLVAYQIGWGKALIRWYESGLQGKIPDMPGDGFLKWDYTAIAKHFYSKYRYDAGPQQLKALEETVSRILEIVQEESRTGNLERLNVWEWCTLRSGKPWPLAKWIQVNTVAPYLRAEKLIRQGPF